MVLWTTITMVIAMNYGSNKNNWNSYNHEDEIDDRGYHEIDGDDN